MTPLFDLGALARCPDDDPAVAPSARTRATKAAAATIAAPKPVDYWVRGVFRHGDGRFTRTVQAVGMRDRLDGDVARFVAYLTAEGWQFPEGRALLVELLGVGADDGVQIALSSAQG